MPNKYTCGFFNHSRRCFWLKFNVTLYVFKLFFFLILFGSAENKGPIIMRGVFLFIHLDTSDKFLLWSFKSLNCFY